MNNIQSFYKNKKIFVTGHTGFKGSWLVSVLLKFGANVTGYSLNDEKRSLILSRINRIENEDSDIIEVPRLYEGEWNTLLEAVILKCDDSKDSDTLNKNLEYIHQEQFKLESILIAFLNGVEDENIENDLFEILANITNKKVYEFLKLVNGNDNFDVLGLLNSLKIFDTDSVRIVKTGKY